MKREAAAFERMVRAARLSGVRQHELASEAGKGTEASTEGGELQ